MLSFMIPVPLHFSTPLAEYNGFQLALHCLLGVSEHVLVRVTLHPVLPGQVGYHTSHQ